MASFKNYLKDIEPIDGHMTYDSILNKFKNELSEELYICNEDNVKKADKRSGYVHIILNEDTKWSNSLRISNHLPTLQNLFNNGFIPANRKWGNICLMFMGKFEFNNIDKPSDRGNYGMFSSRKEIRLNGIKNIEFIKKYYEAGQTIPYNIYHFVPELLVEENVDKIISSSNQWILCMGNQEFQVPSGFAEKAFNKVISCDAIIITLNDSKESNSKKLEESVVIPSSSPKLMINIGTVRLYDQNNDFVDITGMLLVKSCTDEQLDMLKKFKSLIESPGIKLSTNNTKKKK